MIRSVKEWRLEHDGGQRKPLEEVIFEQRPELGRGERDQLSHIKSGRELPRKREEEGTRPAVGMPCEGWHVLS